MKKTRFATVLIVIQLLVSSCGQKEAGEDDRIVTITNRSEQTEVTRNAEGRAEMADNKMITNGKLPKELSLIPQEYFTESEQQGDLVELTYDTFESMTYEQRTTVLHKRAIVYLPYGYSEDTQYNVFYLMNGGWSDETTCLGTPDAPGGFKNVLDHAIEDGKIRPMIVVCPTYNNESGEDSGDYSLAIRLTDNYHNELINDLIPAVEGIQLWREYRHPGITGRSADFRWVRLRHGELSSIVWIIFGTLCHPAEI